MIPTFRALRHFVTRDLQDSAVMWVMLLLISAVGGFVILGQGSSERLGVVALGYAYFFFFLIYLSQIWNGVFGRAIPREYILSLPLSRTHAFWIMWVRSLVGMLPLLVLLACYRDDVKFALRAARGHLILDPPLSDPLFAFFVAGAVWMFMTIFATAQTNQATLMTAKRQKRYIPWLKYFVSLGLDLAVFGVWTVLFTGTRGWPLIVGLAVGCLGYSAFKTRIAYVHWMWGADARVLRRR